MCPQLHLYCHTWLFFVPLVLTSARPLRTRQSILHNRITIQGHAETWRRQKQRQYQYCVCGQLSKTQNYFLVNLVLEQNGVMFNLGYLLWRSWQQALVWRMESISGLSECLLTDSKRTQVQSELWLPCRKHLSWLPSSQALSVSEIPPAQRPLNTNFRTVTLLTPHSTIIIIYPDIIRYQILFARGNRFSFSKTWRMLPWPYKGFRHIY